MNIEGKSDGLCKVCDEKYKYIHFADSSPHWKKSTDYLLVSKGEKNMSEEFIMTAKTCGLCSIKFSPATSGDKYCAHCKAMSHTMRVNRKREREVFQTIKKRYIIGNNMFIIKLNTPAYSMLLNILAEARYGALLDEVRENTYVEQHEPTIKEEN